MTGLFGLAEVAQWNFESWNEPQNKKHFDGLNVSTEGYLKYYDACSEGLKMAHPSLRLGGPATGFPDKHPIFWVHIFNIYSTHSNISRDILVLWFIFIVGQFVTMSRGREDIQKRKLQWK